MAASKTDVLCVAFMGSGVVVGGTKSGRDAVGAGQGPSVEMSDIVGPREGKLYPGQSVFVDGRHSIVEEHDDENKVRYRFSFEMMKRN